MREGGRRQMGKEMREKGIRRERARARKKKEREKEGDLSAPKAVSLALSKLQYILSAIAIKFPLSFLRFITQLAKIMAIS